MNTETFTNDGHVGAQSCSAEQAIEVARTIHSQIDPMVLMSLGAGRCGYARTRNGALAFQARILPFKKDGTRSERPRIMSVMIALNGDDYYDVKVRMQDNQGRVQTHFEQGGVDAFSLSRLLLALDYDGDEVLNPRYV